MWNEKDLAGGPLTSDLSTPYVAAVATPLLVDIRDTPSYGFYRILNLKYTMYDSRDLFYDIEILST